MRLTILGGGGFRVPLVYRENREVAGAGERASGDMDSGGYENVALALMRAIAHDERTTLILNVRNRGALDGLDADAVVEVPCVVDANGARPLAAAPRALAIHPLVDSVTVAQRLLERFETDFPQLGYLRGKAER